MHDVPAEEIRAILITHEHTDHTAGVRILAKRLNVPVFASSGTRRAGRLDYLIEDVRGLEAGEETSIAGLRVRAFRTSHDAADPIGFRFDAATGDSFGLVTDTGEFTPEAAEALTGCTFLGIEHNHDETMLANGPYPHFLKRRISSSFGHLSNTAASEALLQLAHDGLQAVAGLHVSRTNNRSEIVSGSLSASISSVGLDIPVTCVAQDRPCMMPLPATCA